jgi:hypothetical protein
MAVQVPPTRVDHKPLRVRNRLRPMLAKQVNRKVFHHVVEEVFLTPSAEEPHAVLHPRGAIRRADQAHLMAASPDISHEIEDFGARDGPTCM